MGIRHSAAAAAMVAAEVESVEAAAAEAARRQAGEGDGGAGGNGGRSNGSGGSNSGEWQLPPGWALPQPAGQTTVQNQYVRYSGNPLGFGARVLGLAPPPLGACVAARARAPAFSPCARENRPLAFLGRASARWRARCWARVQWCFLWLWVRHGGSQQLLPAFHVCPPTGCGSLQAKVSCRVKKHNGGQGPRGPIEGSALTLDPCCAVLYRFVVPQT